MEEYPPNSDKSKTPLRAEKRVERVTSSEPKRRKRPLRKQLSETFVAGSPRSALQYVMAEVLVPAARDMISEMFTSGINNLIYGDRGRRRGSVPPQAGPTGYISYNRVAGGPTSKPPQALSQKARARHDFDEIVLSSRTEAEEVVDRLFDLVSRYDYASVADLYELVGFAGAHTDNKWGWTDLHGAGVTRIREGYLLDLPEPQPLG